MAKKRSPVVFVSSTAGDLKEYRAAARDAVLAASFQVLMQEYFEASANDPYTECMARVERADLVVAIVAHRYGWIPPDQPNPDERKSITWLECERAKELLVFVLEEDAPWPEERKEEFRLTAAIRDNRATPELFRETNDRVQQLKRFKSWLDGGSTRATFSSPEQLRAKVSEAFLAWLKKHPQFLDLAEAIPEDPGKYLRSLLASNSHIDIRGLQVGTGRAHRFPIDALFITLTTTLEDDSEDAASRDTRESWAFWDLAAPLRAKKQKKDGKNEKRERMAGKSLPLQAALAQSRLVIIGDPGSGKTTFLKRAVFELCREGTRPESAVTPFPVLVKLAELREFIDASRQASSVAARTAVDRPVWLTRFLADRSADAGWGLSESFFRKRLQGGGSVVFLDGLDEAPDRASREGLSRLVENLGQNFPDCSIVVTTRPAAYLDGAVLPGFTHARIDPLDPATVEAFLKRWCDSLYPDDPGEAERHRKELLGALAARPEIRRMAVNPVMLTALAVLHWNEKRLPEQRADLYESIVRWLARSREARPNRPSAERAVVLIQEVALAMQDHRGGRQTQIGRRAAAEAIADEWTDSKPAERLRLAEEFLDAEELDSGVVVRRGGDIAFWHLTFQEFLAARAIAGRPDADQHTRLFSPKNKMYRPEWREAILLFGGILHQLGRAKMDAFVSKWLDSLGSRPSLVDQARAAGLLGAMLRDLEPVNYQVRDSRFDELLDRVLPIFDARRARSVPVQTRIEAAEALGQAGDPRLDPDDPARWVEIPEGPFSMGAQKETPQKPNYDPEAYDDEAPVHEVRLDAFAIARYPVTVMEFERFVDEGGYDKKAFWSAGGQGRFQAPEDWEQQKAFPNRPAVGVSWYEAAAFAAWAGCRLPSEAQWERAARGTAGRRFPWGDDDADPDRLNYAQSGLDCPTPVGIYPDGATPDGIFDLAGNVWEWCQDWFNAYTGEPSENPRGLEDGAVRVLRGGSFVNNRQGVRSAFRGWSLPDLRRGGIGFRVVAPPGSQL